MRQLGAVPVQPEDLNDAGDRGRGRRVRRQPQVDGDGGPFAPDAVRVRDPDVAESAGEQRRALHVRGFVEAPRFPLLGGARDGEAGDAVHGGRAEVEGRCEGEVVGFLGGPGAAVERRGGGEEGGGVGVEVVGRAEVGLGGFFFVRLFHHVGFLGEGTNLDQFGKDGLEVFQLAVEEWIYPHRALAIGHSHSASWF